MRLAFKLGSNSITHALSLPPYPLVSQRGLGGRKEEKTKHQVLDTGVDTLGPEEKFQGMAGCPCVRQSGIRVSYLEERRQRPTALCT